MCLHHDAFSQMFQRKVSALTLPGEHQNYHRILCEIIRLHVRTKEWFLQTADIYRHFVLIQLFGSVMFLTCAVFQLDLQFKHPDGGLGFLLCCVAVSMSNLFVYCYFGKVATESYTKIPNYLYDANWQQVPVNLQKYIIVMIANGQRPLYYHGFGIAVLNLETFCALLRAVGTYFMAFKTLTE
ncbi:odorant receptor 22c-like [Sitodiplosis mosellana]|uniref:odorant receptor 22c-like n=1 Tax=Sitodiplosis mosellana TaxID=263140 RepID=UPI002443BE4B|nr:odorant receptor 22c-like [Sitodiplosis mosellana]